MHPEIPWRWSRSFRCSAWPRPDRPLRVNAGELAADLQAVADDQPLPFAHEPWPGRVNPLGSAADGCGSPWPRWSSSAMAGRRLRGAPGQSSSWSSAARPSRSCTIAAVVSAENDEFSRAMVQFEAAARPGREFVAGSRTCTARPRESYNVATETGAIRDAADELFRVAKPLRFRLIRLCGDLRDGHQRAEGGVQAVLRPRPPAMDEPHRADPARRRAAPAPCLREVHELAVPLDRGPRSLRRRGAAGDGKAWRSIRAGNGATRRWGSPRRRAPGSRYARGGWLARA